MKSFLLTLPGRFLTVVGLTVVITSASADPQVSTLRGPSDLNQEPIPPRMQKTENDDIKRERAYPQQSPTIPHDISQYQLDQNFNKCMECHSRKKADESQAPAVSVTHYMNRDGEFLAELSPRRYFCTQCHVKQLDAKPLLDNQFTDMDELLNKPAE